MARNSRRRQLTHAQPTPKELTGTVRPRRRWGPVLLKVLELLIVPLLLLAITWRLESQIASDGERRDNVRFVREVAVSASNSKPFQNLDLREAMLNGIDLSCAKRGGRDCARFDYADLEKASLIGAGLDGSKFLGADLRGADLLGAHLSHASLLEADLRNAWLVQADLSGSELSGANLLGASSSTQTSMRFATMKIPAGLTAINQHHLMMRPAC